MPNVKISAAADAGTLLASDMLPLARSGDTNAYHATMAEIASYASVSVSSGAYGNTGRNLIHNPTFAVVQRGVGPFTAQGYTLDRWEHLINSDTVSIAQVGLTDAQRAAISDESATYSYDNTFTGNAAASAYNIAVQRIEDLRRLSGKTVTVSFWAWCAVAPKSLGISIDQVTGTGGSPSPSVVGTGQAQVITTTPSRYSKTFTIPSCAGLTLGTNNDHCTQLNIWFSSGTTNASRAGSIGVQSGHIALWGVQLEIGSAVTSLEKLEYAEQLLDCVRFYQTGYINEFSYAQAGALYQATVFFVVPMRAAPSVTLYSPSLTNLPAISAVGTGPFYAVIGGVAIATAATGMAAAYGASADL